ncbi:hypothetical protein AOLI_G00099410 [Acnodon oligacanthus]
MTGGRRDKEGPLVFGCICFIACYSETDRCFLQGPSHRPAAYSALLFHTEMETKTEFNGNLMFECEHYLPAKTQLWPCCCVGRPPTHQW